MRSHMTLERPGLVLIHGAFHSGRCWAPTVAALRRLAPEVPVVAVDLPGRGSTPGDVGTLTIADFTENAVEQIERAGLGDVVVVAHSLGGLTAPAVVSRLGAARVARLVLIAAVVQPDGVSNLETIPPPVRWIIARALRPGRPVRPPPRAFASFFFCNGMTPEQRDLVLDHLCAEAPGPFHERVHRANLPASVRLTADRTRRVGSTPKGRARQEAVEVAAGDAPPTGDRGTMRAWQHSRRPDPKTSSSARSASCRAVSARPCAPSAASAARPASSTGPTALTCGTPTATA